MKKSKEITLRVKGFDIEGNEIIETYKTTVLTIYGKIIMFIKGLFIRKPHFPVIKKIEFEE